MKSYLELERALHAKGIGSYLQNSDLLVVSGANPATPHSNCFWITNKKGQWYLGTFLPAVYQFSTNADLCAICESILKSAAQAIYEVDEALAEKLNLRRLTETEIEVLGLDSIT